jgi:hypothetical protein
MQPKIGSPEGSLTPVFARRRLVDVPKNRMPNSETDADAAYELIHLTS